MLTHVSVILGVFVWFCCCSFLFFLSSSLFFVTCSPQALWKPNYFTLSQFMMEPTLSKQIQYWTYILFKVSRFDFVNVKLRPHLFSFRNWSQSAMTYAVGQNTNSYKLYYVAVLSAIDVKIRFLLWNGTQSESVWHQFDIRLLFYIASSSSLNVYRPLGVLLSLFCIGLVLPFHRTVNFKFKWLSKWKFSIFAQKKQNQNWWTLNWFGSAC